MDDTSHRIDNWPKTQDGPGREILMDPATGEEYVRNSRTGELMDLRVATALERSEKKEPAH